MKRSIIITILFFCLSIPADALSKDPIKIVYFHDFQPFSWEDGNKQMHGILIDVLTECITNRMGINTTHKGYPWARAQNYVKTGQADAFSTLATPERRTYTEVSNEPVIVITGKPFLYTLNPDFDKLKQVDSISGLKQFKHIQYIGNGWAKQHLQEMDVRWVPTLSDTLQILADGSSHVFISSSQVVNFNIKKLGYQDKIIEVPNDIHQSPFKLCIGKKSPYVHILPIFDKTLKQMRDDGTLEKIYNKYR